jgi:hypothetical protein
MPYIPREFYPVAPGVVSEALIAPWTAGVEGAAECRAPISSISYLQPEQSAQQSAEEQHPVRVAFAVPASPTATTATNTITLNVFIVFSFRSGKSCSEAELIFRTAGRLLTLLSKRGEYVSAGGHPDLHARWLAVSQWASKVEWKDGNSTT